MEKVIYLNNLFDIYKDLLTDKQQLYFKEYYCNNLSYGEISEKYNITRNAIFHQLKLITEKLELYEEKLMILKKKESLESIINKINDSDIKKELESIF